MSKFDPIIRELLSNIRSHLIAHDVLEPFGDQLSALLDSKQNGLSEDFKLPNPNVAIYQPYVDQALEHVATEISAVLGNRDVPISASTYTHKKLLVRGRRKHTLYITVDVKAPYEPKLKVRDIALRCINQVLQTHNLLPIKIYVTSGSSMSSNYRIVVPGDDDYNQWS